MSRHLHPRLRALAGLRDAALVVVVSAATLGALAVRGDDSTGDGRAAVALIASAAGCAALARSWPVTATLLASPLCVGFGLLGATEQSISEAAMLVVMFPLVYRLATRARRGPAIAGTAWLAAAWQGGALWGGGVAALNPSIIFGAVGPCVVGLIVRSRAEARATLYERRSELLLAREQYVRESVRVERTRIARELHDIVAHRVTAMVVQAHAGQKLALRDPARAAEAFDQIAGSARQAATEMTRLIALLQPNDRRARSIDELVTEVRACGLSITCRVVGNLAWLDPVVADAAYAVSQEAITNALKHAPGAPLEITMDVGHEVLRLTVTNGPARVGDPCLATTGGGRGLIGMRQRVAACEGTLVAQCTADGGWRVVAQLRATPRAR